ncbi:WD40-repeat-containing domain protein [Dipodascopsis uninucleata]
MTDLLSRNTQSVSVDDSEAGKGGQIKITLTTRDPTVAVPNVPLYVPLSLRRYGLSEVVNHLLATEVPIPFDFLIKSELLRVSLQDYITSHGISSEQVLELEYTRSILPPTFLASFTHPDWVSSVDVEKSNSQELILSGMGQILSGCYDGIVRSWDLSGNVKVEFSGHTGPVKTVRWLDDKRIVSGGLDRAIRMWKVPTSDEDEPVGITGSADDDSANIIKGVESSRVYTGHTSTVESVAVDAKTSRILSAGADGIVGIWTTNYKEAPKSSIAVPVRNTVKRRRQATSQAPQSSRGPLSMMESHTGAVTDVIFDPKDTTVGYSVSIDHTIKTWDLITSALVDTRTTSYSLLAICSLPALSLLCCGSSARHVTLHDPRASSDSTTSQTLIGHTNFVVDLAPNPDNDFMFASASYDGTVRVWDVRAQKSLFIISRESKADLRTKVFGLDWANHVGIVSAGEDRKVQINNHQS